MAPQSPTTSSRRKRLRLIDNWRSGLRMLNVRVLLVLGAAVEGWMFLSPEQQRAVVEFVGLPPERVVLVGVLAALIARFIKQESVSGQSAGK